MLKYCNFADLFEATDSVVEPVVELFAKTPRFTVCPVPAVFVTHTSTI
jgi:hypothetical protein